MAQIDENIINDLVRRKVVTDTFRRLSPEKKEKLYKTALQQFGKYGYDGLAVDQFCYQAKISKGSFFQYFPSKSHLLEFCLLLFDSAFFRVIEDIKTNESKILAKDRISNLMTALTSFIYLDEIEKRFYLFVTNALHHSAVTIEGISTGRHADKFIFEIVKRGIETKEIRSDYSADITAPIVASSFDSILTGYFLTNAMPDSTTLNAFISILFDGIKS